MSIKFSALTRSHTDLVKSWVRNKYQDDFLIVLYDPLNHPDLLKLLNLNHDSLKNLYESKVLALLFQEMDEIQKVFKIIVNNSSIYGQLYYKGYYIIDTIDYNL